jgi:iron complex transport system substrate-binding protein
MTELNVHDDIVLPARRIVSLAPSITEILFFLGLGKHVAGVTGQCDFPDSAQRKNIVGSFLKPDIKRIDTLSPDMIIGLKDLHEHIPDMIDSGHTGYIMFDYRSVSGVLDAMEIVAGIAEHIKTASQRVASLRHRVRNVQMEMSERPAVRTLFMMYDDPVYTPGCGSYQYDALEIAGAVQMQYNNAQYERVTVEQVVDFDPQVIFACGRHRNEPPRKVCSGCQAENPICLRIVDDIGIRPQWRKTSAARNDRIIAILCDWLCRAGPRLVDGMEKIAQILTGINAER